MQKRRYKLLKGQGLDEEAIMDSLRKPVRMQIFTWQGDKDVNMSPLDSIATYLKYLNTGFLAMDPHTGDVLAWVGGINHEYFQYDHVRQHTRQVGSTFKPIVYAAALEQGIAPCDYISAERTVYEDMDGWSPSNGGEDNYDKKYSMEGGLTYSVNTVSVRLAEETGLEHTVSLAHKMGIESNIPKVPSIALGTPSVSLLEMVTAYASFVNKGNRVTPVFIKAITDRNGAVLEAYERVPVSAQERAMSEETALMMLHMLKRVVNEGTGASLRSQYGLHGELAGKTGTTQANADGWFMAVTPRLVAGAWVGADDPAIRFRTTALGQGAHMALPIFARFYQQMEKDPDYRRWTRTSFPALTPAARRKLDCDLYKEDMDLIDRLFGRRPPKVVKRAYGEKKKKPGFFKRLFSQ